MKLSLGLVSVFALVCLIADYCCGFGYSGCSYWLFAAFFDVCDYLDLLLGCCIVGLTGWHG